MKPTFSDEELPRNRHRRWRLKYRNAPKLIEYALTAAILAVALIPVSERLGPAVRDALEALIR